jgi:hypothetical protein
MKRDPTTGSSNFYAFARDYLHTYLPTVARRSPKILRPLARRSRVAETGRRVAR